LLGGGTVCSAKIPSPMELALSWEDPRVARSEQPWAGGRNAVGVGVESGDEGLRR
jgi:hypothetical protein